MISAAVLGLPISHSLSPLLHSTVYSALGIDATYTAYEVGSGQLAGFLHSEGSSLDSLSLTMPLKEEAIGVADTVSDVARQIGSGNTLHKIAGRWNLTSTDTEGFSYALQSHQRDAKGNVLIIGAGATARAIVAACDGISQTVTVINRNTDREQVIRKSGPGLDINFLPWSAGIDFNEFDLVVNTTPGEAASIFSEQVSSVSATFFEVLYHPWPTRLLAKWRSSGGFGIDGLDLLIHQAISQAEIFASCSIDRVVVAKMLRKVGEKALS